MRTCSVLDVRGEPLCDDRSWDDDGWCDITRCRERIGRHRSLMRRHVSDICACTRHLVTINVTIDRQTSSQNAVRGGTGFEWAGNGREARQIILVFRGTGAAVSWGHKPYMLSGGGGLCAGSKLFYPTRNAHATFIHQKPLDLKAELDLRSAARSGQIKEFSASVYNSVRELCCSRSRLESVPRTCSTSPSETSVMHITQILLLDRVYRQLLQSVSHSAFITKTCKESAAFRLQTTVGCRK